MEEKRLVFNDIRSIRVFPIRAIHFVPGIQKNISVWPFGLLHLVCLFVLPHKRLHQWFGSEDCLTPVYSTCLKTQRWDFVAFCHHPWFPSQTAAWWGRDAASLPWVGDWWFAFMHAQHVACRRVYSMADVLLRCSSHCRVNPFSSTKRVTEAGSRSEWFGWSSKGLAQGNFFSARAKVCKQSAVCLCHQAGILVGEAKESKKEKVADGTEARLWVAKQIWHQWMFNEAADHIQL